MHCPLEQSVPLGLAGFEHAPIAESQTPASWHSSSAMQSIGAPAMQVPAMQPSFIVHALPSSQLVPSGFSGFEHIPVAGSHVPAL
jgi:hypothetical protein